MTARTDVPLSELSLKDILEELTECMAELVSLLEQRTAERRPS